MMEKITKTGTSATSATSASLTPAILERLRGAARRDLGPALAGSVLPFALIIYLGLKGGGYDAVVYGQVGVAIWWLILLGALVGILPVARVPRAGWVGLGLLAAFAVWTALGIGWSESAERSAAEAGRVATYLGVLALAITTQGRDGVRRAVGAVGTAIAVIGVLALLSRLYPAWFPDNDAAAALQPELAHRLGYPLNYWNGLAALMAMGAPLVLAIALQGRHLATRALATAALPAMALTIFYTFSRGGMVALALALVAFLALYQQRGGALPTMLTSGAGAAILIAGAAQRSTLESSPLTEAARAQAHEMFAMALVVCAGVALVRIAIALAARHGLRPHTQLHPRWGAALVAGAVAVVVAIALAVGLPTGVTGESDPPATEPLGTERFADVDAGRGQYWKSALDANASAPLVGIGPGTFDYWWSRESTEGYVRDAHSLFFETLAELGVVGLLLVLSLMGTVLVVGGRRALAARPEACGVLAAAVAACVAFVVAATADWAWELPVLPVAFLLLAGALLGHPTTVAGSDPDPDGDRSSTGSRRPRIAIRVGLAVLAIASLVTIALPLAGAALARQSEDRREAGQLDSAVDSARKARTLQPYAATPRLEEALALRQSGALEDAAGAARAATDKEPTNWRTWFLLSQIEAERGRGDESAAAYAQAQVVNLRVELRWGSAPPWLTSPPKAE